MLSIAEHPPRHTAIALAVIVLLALLASTAEHASAYGVKYANFDATISGTYVNEGTLTSSGCFRFDEEAGERVELGAMAGKHSERTTFRSTRSILLGVEKTDGQKRIVAGGKAIPVKVAMKRESELANPFEVRGCTPQGDQFDTSCGTKTKRFKLSLFAKAKRQELTYALSKGFSNYFPEDPFACPVPESSAWWGSYYRRGNGTGKLSAKKLLDKNVKRIVIRGGLTRTTGDKKPAEGWEAKGTETLRWKVVLKRRAR